MTTEVAVREPHLAVIVAVPGVTPVTVPSEATVATLVLEEDQVTGRVVLAGETVAFRACLAPVFTTKLGALRVREVGFTTAFRVKDLRREGSTMLDRMTATSPRVIWLKGAKVPVESVPERTPAR